MSLSNSGLLFGDGECKKLYNPASPFANVSIFPLFGFGLGKKLNGNPGVGSSPLKYDGLKIPIGPLLLLLFKLAELKLDGI